jgi:aspartyl/asparaginyl-tRNA synthetase
MLMILRRKEMPRPKKGWGAKFVPTTKVKRAGTPQKDIYFMRRYDWRISPFYHKLVKDDKARNHFVNFLNDFYKQLCGGSCKNPLSQELCNEQRLNYDKHIYDSWDLYRANWALIETYYDNYLEGL